MWVEIMPVVRSLRVNSLTLILLLLLNLCPQSSIAQEARTGLVVSDNELATQAGMEILSQGGSAVDAAVATAFALGVVDPASSGIGGGGFMVIYQRNEKKAHALDFRETAPAAAHKDLYVKNGKLNSRLSVKGPLAVAVPGEVAGLVEALKRFGRLSLRAVMRPAIRYAEEGFSIHSYLRHSLERHIDTIRKIPELSRAFLNQNEVPADGEKIRQPELGIALKAIAEEGPEVFYGGWIGQAIAEEMKNTGGILSLDDLKEYRAMWRKPMLGGYRGRTVITMPPPSSGGVALLQMLKVLERYPLGQIPHNSTNYLHLLAEVMKHAFSDRAQYLGDPDFVQMPISKLLSEEYITWTRQQISPIKTRSLKFYGITAFKPERGGTTHFGVVDAYGNAVACTLTINTRFGSKVAVPKTGIILNNQMDDFSLQPGVPNVYGLIGNEANSIQAKKRPLSSMAPTILLKGERPFLIAGASGGPRIISATLQTILNVLDFRIPLDKAVELPRIHHQWIPNILYFEKELSPSTRKSLKRRGHKLRERRSVGVVQAISVKGGKISGKADPRKTRRAQKKNNR